MEHTVNIAVQVCQWKLLWQITPEFGITGSRPRLNTQIQALEPARFAELLIFKDIMNITGSGISVQNVAVRAEERRQGAKHLRTGTEGIFPWYRSDKR